MDEESDDGSDDSMQDPQEAIKTVEQRQKGQTPPIKVQVVVHKVSIPMEVDTGASVAIMSESTYHKLWPRRGLSISTIRLQTYSKELIKAVGTISDWQRRWSHRIEKEVVDQD